MDKLDENIQKQYYMYFHMISIATCSHYRKELLQTDLLGMQL